MSNAPDSTAASALAELDAAQRLVADPDMPPRVAAVHLRRVWMGLAGVEDEPEAGRTIARGTVDARTNPAVRAAQQRVVDWLFEGPPTDEPLGGTPDSSELLGHIELLRGVMNREPAGRDPVLGWALGFLGLVVLALAGLGAWGLVRGPTGPWMVHWFPERDFTGKVRVEYVRGIDFDWGKASPHRGIPEDDWSARFQTCLEVDEETKIRFKLTSDDGSRLYIDEEKVVDNWGDHGSRARMGTRTLQAGTYHLQIDYYEARHGAKLVLEVAFDDEDFGPLPPEWIRQPDSDADTACE